MSTSRAEAFEITEVIVTESEELESGWFARERTSVAPRTTRTSFPPRPSAPPMGDADVDSWLR